MDGEAEVQRRMLSSSGGDRSPRLDELDITEWGPVGVEQLGTKPKRWLEDPAGTSWLFKEVTNNRRGDGSIYAKGDDWAERVAASVATALGLPAAQVELAVDRSGDSPIYGIVSRKVLGDDESLIHGNELLAGIGVVGSSTRDRSGYTLAAVRKVLGDVAPPTEDDGLTAWEWWVGYVVLDALVGNTDRHQENWAVIENGERRLAPTFDHASCLGFLLDDATRSEALETADRNRTVEAFAARATSKLEGRPHPCSVAIDALGMVGNTARERLLGRVEGADGLGSVLAQIPERRASPVAREFAGTLYQVNRARLLSQAVGTLTP